ncbi:MAG: efflux RND transporter permease subunit [Pseudomonadota bacterium]
MTGLVSWCMNRARMVLAFIAIALGAGLYAYTSLPREGSPDIDIPFFYISVPLPGVSAVDSERLLVKPLETELRGIDNLKQMTGIASEGHAAILLEFDFAWDKKSALADVRDKVDQAQAEFPDAAEEPSIIEVNMSEFPVLVVSLSGGVPERTLLKLSKDLQREIEADARVLDAELTGHREEMLEVLIDPLKLEAYNVTAQELLSIIDRNNQLVAAGTVESATAEFSISVPGAFENARDVFDLPIKTNGDRVVRLTDLATIRRTFEDPEGLARYNGQPSISIQISKRIGENIIDTVEGVRTIVDAEIAKWPDALQKAVAVDVSMDQSNEVRSMVTQLEGSVATAILLVMIVVLAALGFRSALLVGVAIPCSFLLSFALMQALGLSINNMVMFGLILAVGMLVDGAIVVVEYADKEVAKGTGPMRAYAAAAKRMFWPIVASTATTLCAFLPMLLWPGMPGKFMEQLPTTLIFVLSASLIVALIFLPVLGGVTGRVTRALSRLRGRKGPVVETAGAYQRTPFGKMLALIVMNPLGPFLAIGTAIGALFLIFSLYGSMGKGTEFFVETEPERAIIYVRARGNISLHETDRLVREVEARIAGVEDIKSVFAFSGSGGLNNASGQEGPPDSVGEVQIEFYPWNERRKGNVILAEIEGLLQDLPGGAAEISRIEDGPQQGKPIQLELKSGNWADLRAAADTARAHFATYPEMINVDDTRPLPGIEWQITVDRAAAGRFGADVATVGPLVQLVTRGALLGTYRPDDSDEELEIRVRFPEEDRLLSTLDQLRVPTARGPVPLAHFIERTPVPKLGEIQRRDGERFFLVRADVAQGAARTDVEIIGELETWIAEERPFASSVSARFGGDREEQEESMAFLGAAFMGALGLMFVILLAQFNSFYNSVLVLSAVVMSVGGVLVGMLVMGQKFSIIMTGTGIVALAGIVVNNNIVLIDTFQELRARMAPLEAIVRTAEARIRPVLLTTITTMAGLTPMMFATSLDFGTGTMAVGAPTALWWVQLATAVVFGLGIATLLTLLVTPAALAAREWVGMGLFSLGQGVAAGIAGRASSDQRNADAELDARFRAEENRDLIFAEPKQPKTTTLQAAE